MADEDEDKHEDDGAEGKPDGAEAGAGDDSQGAGNGTEDNAEKLTDKHGQEAVSKGRYQRDMKEANDKIAELTRQLDEASKTDERAKGLKDELEKVQSGFADKELSYKLELAGCLNAKAAKAILSDYDGDIDKCKAENPYLFSGTKKTGKTGMENGAAGNAALEKALDDAFRAH